MPLNLFLDHPVLIAILTAIVITTIPLVVGIIKTIIKHFLISRRMKKLEGYLYNILEGKVETSLDVIAKREHEEARSAAFSLSHSTPTSPGLASRLAQEAQAKAKINIAREHLWSKEKEKTSVVKQLIALYKG